MISLLVGTGTVTLTIWTVAVALVTARTRTRRTAAPGHPQDFATGPLPEPVDPALRRVLAAVRRHPHGDLLRDSLLAAAFEGLMERELLQVEMRPDGPWADVTKRYPPGLPPHEEALLIQLQAAAARTTRPLPIAELRPEDNGDVRVGWLVGLVDGAMDWARRGGHVRDRVRRPVRVLMWAALLVPVESFTAAAVVAADADAGSAAGTVVWSLLLGFVAGGLLTWPLDGRVLTATGERALAAPAPALWRPSRPPAAEVAHVITDGGRRPTWRSADEG